MFYTKIATGAYSKVIVPHVSQVKLFRLQTVITGVTVQLIIIIIKHHNIIILLRVHLIVMDGTCRNRTGVLDAQRLPNLTYLYHNYIATAHNSLSCT